MSQQSERPVQESRMKHAVDRSSSSLCVRLIRTMMSCELMPITYTTSPLFLPVEEFMANKESPSLGMTSAREKASTSSWLVSEARTGKKS